MRPIPDPHRRGSAPPEETNLSLNTPPFPVIFEPIFKAKPWGGRALASVCNKTLPGDEPIGESWELVSLPGNESRVRSGPLAGRTVSELLEAWGRGLHGDTALADGRFPLLIKFLDAREHLSVQVHPKPPDDDPSADVPGVKHEAWYVVHAEPGAELFIGLKPDVTPNDVAAAADTPRMKELLRRWPVKAGQCYYLPSGTMHALGAGIVVAEIQTPSDVTYRLYDWERVGRDGKPRELHIEQGLSNVLYNVRDELIQQPRRHVAGPFITLSHLIVCERFVIDKVRIVEGVSQELPHTDMVIWIVLKGSGTFRRDEVVCEFTRGDVVLIPAESRGLRLEIACDFETLEVKVPIRSRLADLPRPEPEPAPGLGPPDATRLTHHGKPIDPA